MNKVKVSEATNTQLDWLVAKCEGATSIRFDGEFWRVLIQEPGFLDYEEYLGNLDYTADPSLMWPIIEREKIILQPPPRGERYASSPWSAGWDYDYDWMMDGEQSGPTSLIAAARCYVASKLGEEVEVPEELK